MGYDGGDIFPFDFEPNGIPFGLKSKGKLSPRSSSVSEKRASVKSLAFLGIMGAQLRAPLKLLGQHYSIEGFKMEI